VARKAIIRINTIPGSSVINYKDLDLVITAISALLRATESQLRNL
jgi:hypothetical protein